MRWVNKVRFPDPPKRLRAWAVALFACAVLLIIGVLTAFLRAQDKNPFSGDAKAAKLGESQFRANCAFCHGLGARGGGRGGLI
jgi:mono/diheme cytochrome c family protein